MAVFKPGATPPPKSERINGDVYDYGCSTPQIRAWHSPREAPSARFTEFDSLARLADFAWNDLATEDQQEWNDRADSYQSGTGPICAPRRKYTTCDRIQKLHGSTFSPAAPGQSYHRATYIESMRDGIEPPILPFIADWDWQQPHLQFSWGDGPKIYYEPIEGIAMAELRLTFLVRTVPTPDKPLDHQAGKWRELFRCPFYEYTWLNFDDLWAPYLAAHPWGSKQLLFTVGFIQDAPYVPNYINYPSDSIHQYG